MRVYNPEGSLLRERQKEMLAVLADFAKICEENDIRWWLCSGTLLGAARHKGFIPWDDDVDVSMLKKDYRKLLKVLRKMDNEEYFYQCIQTVAHQQLCWIRCDCSCWNQIYVWKELLVQDIINGNRWISEIITQTLNLTSQRLAQSTLTDIDINKQNSLLGICNTSCQIAHYKGFTCALIK